MAIVQGVGIHGARVVEAVQDRAAIEQNFTESTGPGPCFENPAAANPWQLSSKTTRKSLFGYCCAGVGIKLGGGEAIPLSSKVSGIIFAPNEARYAVDNRIFLPHAIYESVALLVQFFLRNGITKS